MEKKCIFWLSVCFLLVCETGAHTSYYECFNTTTRSRKQVTSIEYYPCRLGGWMRCLRYHFRTEYEEVKTCCDGYEKLDGRCVNELYKVCGRPSDVSPFIVGGTDAALKEYPWLVFINYSGMVCGGALIAKDWVLTAAHCFMDGSDFNAAKAYLVLGEVELPLRTNRNKIGMDSASIHPDWDFSTKSNDIALVKISEEVTFNDCVKPICLPDANLTLNVGDDVEIAGWGITRAHGSLANVLQKAKVQITDRCFFHNTNRICVRDLEENPRQSACIGDSGGPLMLRRNGVTTVIGITSVGKASCDPHYPTIYTDVRKYLDWIDEITRNN